ESAPSSAKNLIHHYVGGLRRLFEPDLPPRRAGRWILGAGDGYRMDVDDTSLDLLRFRREAGEVRTARRTDPATDHTSAFLQALALWRGRCSDGIQAPGSAPLFESIDAEYTVLLKETADETLRHGGGEDVLPLLRAAAHRDAFDEGLQARLIK